MLTTLSAALLLALYGQSAVVGVAEPTEPRLEFGIRKYSAEGRSGGSAWTGANEVGFVWLSPDFCGAGSSGDIAAAGRNRAAYAWRLKSTVVLLASDGWVVDVEWQRVIDDGQAVSSGPMGARRLTLRVDEPVVLDKVRPAAPSQCGVEGRLEANIALRPMRAASGVRAGGGSVGGVGGMGTAGSFGNGGALARLNAELWLVHTRPDGGEESQRVSVAEPSSNFEFSPVRVQDAGGSATVRVSGFLRALQVTDGEVRSVLVSIERRINSDQTPGLSSGGRGNTVVPTPKPTDVVALEMPPVGTGEKGLIAGHLFSLRLRVSPAK